MIYHKKMYKKSKAKRKRNLKWIPLMDNPFPEEVEVDWHHINNIFVIPMPRISHQKCHFSNNTNEHRTFCNRVLSSWYGLNIEKLLEE